VILTKNHIRLRRYISLLILISALLSWSPPSVLRAAEEQSYRTWVKDTVQLIVTNRFDDAQKEIDRIKHDSATMNDPLYNASCSLLTGLLIANRKSGQSPLPFYNDAFQRFSKENDAWGKAVAEYRLGTFFVEQGDTEKAEKMFSECIPVLEKEHEFKLAAISYIQLFTIYRAKNDDTAVDSAMLQAVKNFSDDGDALRAGGSYSQWGHYYFMQGKYEKALQYNKKAVETIEKTEHVDYHVRFLILEANTLSALGQNEEGLILLEKAITLPVVEALTAQVLTVKGDILFAMSRFAESIAEFEKAMALYEKNSMLKEKAEVLLKAQSSNLELGNIDKCLAILNNAIGLYSKLKDPVGESQVRIKLADLLFTSGDTKAARDQYSKALSLLKNEKSPADEAGCLIGLGMIEYYTGNYKKAESLLSGARDLLTKTDPQLTLTDSVYILNSLGTLYFHQGDYRKSEKLYQEALTLSRSGGYSGGEITALECLASLSLQEGKAEKAISLLMESLEKAQKQATLSHIALIHTSLGMCCESLSRPDEAKKYFEASLAINEKTGFKKGMAGDYLNLGYFSCFYRDDIKKAEDYYNKALSIYEEIKDYYGIITALDFLGSIYKNKGDKEKAIWYYKKALETSHQHGYILEEQGVKFRLGYYALLLGDIKNGFREMEQCADFYRKNNMPSSLADMQCFLGNVSLVNLGDNDKAEILCKEARALYEQTGNRKGLLECSLLEASIAADREQYDEAQKIYHAMLKETKPYHDLYISCLNQLAFFNSEILKKYETGLSYLEEAIKSCEDYGDALHSTFFTLRAAHSYIIHSQGNKTLLKKAEELLSRAEIHSQKQMDKNSEIDLFYLKGMLFNEKGEYKKALDAYGESYSKAEDYPNQAIRALEAILCCHMRMGNKKDIDNTVKELYSLIKKQRFTNLRYISEIFGLLAKACLYQKDLKGAESCISEKIDFDIQHYFGILLGSDYALAGLIAELKGDKEKALSFYEKSITLADQYLGKAKTEETRLDLTNYSVDNLLTDKFENYAFCAYGGAIRLLLEKGEYAKACDYSERNRARTFVDSVGSRAWPPLSKVNEKIIENLKNLKEYSGLLDAMTKSRSDAPLVAMNSSPISTFRGSPGTGSNTGGGLNTGGGEPINNIEARRFQAFNSREGTSSFVDIPEEYIEQYKAKYMEILPLLKMESKEYYSLKSSIPATSIGEIQKMLDDNTVLLEYYVDVAGSYLFVITSGAIKTFTIPEGCRTLNEKIGTLRTGIQEEGTGGSPEIGKEVRSSASELYHLLIEPAEQLIAGKKRLVIVPHQNLHYLPFSVLMNKDGNTLINAHTLVYLPSAATLAICREKSRARKTGKEPLLAGFAIGDISAEGLSTLPGSKDELEAIEKLFIRKKVAMEKDFTFQNIAAMSPGANYIHFATHGVLDVSNPYHSGLATPDGLFYVGEIFKMPPLDNCTMTTISACKTALGKIYGGDDLVGISGAFLYAGAPSVTSSLWSVSDESTTLLMSYFYENLSKGMGKDEALQKAQLRLMESYPQPFHWAPFILIGDWEVFR